MFIKSIKIFNFKCLGKKTSIINKEKDENDMHFLDFNFPNGNEKGSGLNILIGNNNAGKSTIFEAILFWQKNFGKRPWKIETASSDSESIKNKKCEKEDTQIEFVFSGKISENFKNTGLKDSIKKFIYIDKKRKECIRIRGIFKDKKLTDLGYKISYYKIWNNNEKKFIGNQEELEIFRICRRISRMFEINILNSKINVQTETSYGIETLCGNLLKHKVGKFERQKDYEDFKKSFDLTFNKEESFIKTELKDMEKKIEKYLEEQFTKAKVSINFEKPKIEDYFKNTKFWIDDGTKTLVDEKGTGMQRQLIFALFQIYSDNFKKTNFSEKEEKKLYIFIDEPEIHLHPNAQTKLLESLMELTKFEQVFIATHSPYFLRNENIKNAGLFSMEKLKNNEIKITDMKEEKTKIFPWSPTWGEINYFAYKLPTIEFHNELYGYLQEKSEKSKINSFDKYLYKKWNVKRNKEYKENKQHKKSKDNQNFTICSYVRNLIHHPENKKNKKYTEKELKESIEILVSIIKKMNNEKKLCK